MAYASLGAREVVATRDDGTLNAGNLTAAFRQDLIGIKVSTFEMHHVCIVNVPSNTVLQVFLGTQLWSTAQLDTIGDWDPAQPLLVQPGQDISFCFNALASVTPAPVVWAWFRYDTAFPNN